MGARVTLTVVGGPALGAEFVYNSRAVVIAGRANDCPLRIVDDDPDRPLVSRHHCLFDINPPQVRVRDFGSLNGTHVNGEEIGRRPPGTDATALVVPGAIERMLTHGDEVRLGGTTLRVEVSEIVSAPPLTSGTKPGLDRYEVIRELGRGGQGSVHLVRDKRSQSLVALKIMSAEGQVDPDACRDFLREVEVLEALRHPNIVQFQHAGNVDGLFYFVCEYCPGGSIGSYVAHRGEPLGIEESLQITLQALEGLSFAHGAGAGSLSARIVHRDIKPANILLTGEPHAWTAKVADFGLAKAFDLAGLSGLTMTGDTAGTPEFMPRQQVLDYKYAKPDVDVFAMAATLFWMLTGHVPRRVLGSGDVFRAVLDQRATPIRDYLPYVPARLAAVIDAALVDNPQIHFEHAADLADALRAAL